MTSILVKELFYCLKHPRFITLFVFIKKKKRFIILIVILSINTGSVWIEFIVVETEN